MKLQYTFTRKFFLQGLCRQTPTRGLLAPGPRRGGTPLCTPLHGKVYILLGVKTSWGINMAKNKIPLNQEDNQAPQPTLGTANPRHGGQITG